MEVEIKNCGGWGIGLSSIDSIIFRKMILICLILDLISFLWFYCVFYEGYRMYLVNEDEIIVVL